ncbi:HNH endonuclease [Sphingomonas suaedae]|uniref:HNH endonuclease n=1 Tax=Sphingomonas suaedae TaxID=2599297 RepID=A0A518RH25_9SPHN|nr:HNH endonuclease [Sphingomonas suaedae]QDX26731.1 HNH endonuclease [Sphingomonas suaedae]
MSLANLTSEAVLKAIAEYDDIGKAAFLANYGFADAKRYWIIQDGQRYPSKAIASAAHKHIDGHPLSAPAFSGGEGHVVRKLRQLGFEVETPGRNPDWIRDELTLALDLYFTNPANPPGKTSAAVATLSNLLNKMHRIAGGTASATFRNTDGVYLKMMNLRALDPTYTAQGKVGMKSGGSLEKIVWAEYAERRAELAADAKAIRDAVSSANEAAVAKLPTVEPYEGEEGGVIVRLHKRYERDPRLVAEKRKAAKLAGDFSCEVCGFDFEAAYGALGAEFIEVHHVNPVHMMNPGAKTKLSDLALLCANCHRMAHRRRVPLTLAELKAAFKLEIGG